MSSRASLLSNTFTYLFGSIMASLISVISLGLMTRNLSVSEFGEFSILLQIAMLSAFIFGLELSGSVIIEYNLMGPSSREYRSMMGSLISFSFLFFIVSSVFLLVSTSISNQNSIFGIDLDLVFIALVSGFSVSLINFGNSYYVISEMPKHVALFRISRALIFLVSLTISVKYLELNTKLAIISESLSTISVACIIMYLLIRKFGLSLDKDSIKSSLLFCLPLMIHGIGIWALVASDRFVLEYYLNYEEVGVYSFGYTIAAFLAMIAASIDNSWSPIFLEICEKNSSFSKIIGSFWTSYPAMLGIICIVFLTASPLVVMILGGPDYSRSNDVIPWIVCGMYFQGLYMLFMKTMPMKKRTMMLASITASISIFNLILTFLLVPEMGINGAAIATCVSYFLLMLVSFFFSQKLEYMQVSITRLIFHISKISFSIAIIAHFYRIDPLQGIASGIVITIFLVITDRFEISNIRSIQKHRTKHEPTTT